MAHSPVMKSGPAMLRTVRQERDRGLLLRAGLRAKDRFESFIASGSIHGDPGIYDNEAFPWAARLEAGWRDIRAELDAVLPEAAGLPAVGDILTPARNITADQRWKSFWLAGYGMECRENARRCPRTMELLGEIPGLRLAFFSILSPRKHLPSHRGAYNGLLRYHLALKVPGPPMACRIRVGNRTVGWEEGKSLVFDDTFHHEVWNDTDETRVVLFVDFARPLRPLHDRLNRLLLRGGTALLPFLRDGRKRYRDWERRFYDGRP